MAWKYILLPLLRGKQRRMEGIQPVSQEDNREHCLSVRGEARLGAPAKGRELDTQRDLGLEDGSKTNG